MKQARTLSDKELNLLLLYINTRKYAARDRLMVLFTFHAGMRIKEVVATRIKDVLANDGTVKFEINLSAEQTKGKFGRTVVLADKLRKEIQIYLQTQYDSKELIALNYSDHINKPLFATQKPLLSRHRQAAGGEPRGSTCRVFSHVGFRCHR